MEEKYREVIKEALKLSIPSKAEYEYMEEIKEKVLNIANQHARVYNAEVMLCGSFAKNTWLPKKYEMDVFILFSPKIDRDRLEELGLLIGRRIAEDLNAEYIIEYAEHPYVRIKYREVQIDVVPAYKVEKASERISAVDRTPFHTVYVREKIKNILNDEVRLLKKFMLANEIYGADAKVNGFSGYVCELLIIHYGSFLNVIKAAANWKPITIIDIENYYSEKEKEFLPKIFKNQPLIIIDPVDKDRNAAAAVSVENYFKFINLARKFLENPSINFFQTKEYEAVKYEELIKYQMDRRTELIVLRFFRPKVVDDIIYPQMRKFANRVENILIKYNFRVLNKDVFCNERYCYLVLEMEISKLPKIEKKIGPIFFDLENTKRFLEKYKDYLTYVEKDRWVAEVPRKFVRAIDKIIDSLSKDEKTLRDKGIPSFVASSISKHFDITNETSKITSFIREDESFGKFLRKFIFKEKLVL
ncbi:MAG: CCA tRNA nucleotidyltransferase [Candidatus Aenigmatarchaeota archaeon]